VNDATTSVPTKENVAAQGALTGQSDLHPEIAGWLPVKRAAPDASAPGSQPVTNLIP
jgi:hypothetical protein